MVHELKREHPAHPVFRDTQIGPVQIPVFELLVNLVEPTLAHHGANRVVLARTKVHAERSGLNRGSGRGFACFGSGQPVVVPLLCNSTGLLTQVAARQGATAGAGTETPSGRRPATRAGTAEHPAGTHATRRGLMTLADIGV